MAKVLKVYATKNEVVGYKGIYYQIGDNQFLVHRGYQTLLFKSMDQLEEINNQSVIKNLIADHNIVISEALTKKNEEGYATDSQIRMALMDALIDEDEYNGEGTYPADWVWSTPPKGYYPLSFYPADPIEKMKYEMDSGFRLVNP